MLTLLDKILIATLFSAIFVAVTTVAAGNTDQAGSRVVAAATATPAVVSTLAGDVASGNFPGFGPELRPDEVEEILTSLGIDITAVPETSETTDALAGKVSEAEVSALAAVSGAGSESDGVLATGATLVNDAALLSITVFKSNDAARAAQVHLEDEISAAYEAAATENPGMTRAQFNRSFSLRRERVENVSVVLMSTPGQPLAALLSFGAGMTTWADCPNIARGGSCAAFDKWEATYPQRANAATAKYRQAVKSLRPAG